MQSWKRMGAGPAAVAAVTSPARRSRTFCLIWPLFRPVRAQLFPAYLPHTPNDALVTLSPHANAAARVRARTNSADAARDSGRSPPTIITALITLLAYHRHIFNLTHTHTHTHVQAVSRRGVDADCCLSPEFVYSAGWCVFTHVIYPPSGLGAKQRKEEERKREERKTISPFRLAENRRVILGFYDLL